MDAEPMVSDLSFPLNGQSMATSRSCVLRFQRSTEPARGSTTTTVSSPAANVAPSSSTGMLPTIGGGEQALEGEHLGLPQEDYVANDEEATARERSGCSEEYTGTNSGGHSQSRRMAGKPPSAVGSSGTGELIRLPEEAALRTLVLSLRDGSFS